MRAALASAPRRVRCACAMPAPGLEVPSQVVDDDGDGTVDELIFQSSFPAERDAPLHRRTASRRSSPGDEARVRGARRSARRRRVGERPNRLSGSTDRGCGRSIRSTAAVSTCGSSACARPSSTSGTRRGTTNTTTTTARAPTSSMSANRSAPAARPSGGTTSSIARSTSRTWRIIANGPVRVDLRAFVSAVGCGRAARH